MFLLQLFPAVSAVSANVGNSECNYGLQGIDLRMGAAVRCSCGMGVKKVRCFPRANEKTHLIFISLTLLFVYIL